MSEQVSLFPEPKKHVLDEGLDVLYEPNFVDSKTALRFLGDLMAQADWHRVAMQLGGKTVYTRRQVAWHADLGYVYRYSGQEHKWKAWTKTMLEIKKLVEIRMGRGFNGVLLNLYKNGEDHVSFHADDEEDMADDVPIVAVSLGAARDFIFKHENGNKHSFLLENGSLVIMNGDTQKVSKHSIPKRMNVKDPRVSLTFRQCIRKSKV